MSGYDVIVVDPPWAYGKANDRSSAGRHYPTIGADTRTASGVEATVAGMLEVAPIPEWAAPDCAVYLWVTNPRIHLGFRILEGWGCEYKTMLTWVKTTASAKIATGMGFYYRGATEHVLLGTRGSYRVPPALRKPNVVLARRRAHSEKPQEFYDLVESTSPGQRRLDVFARQARAGWDVWGNEVESVDLVGVGR